MNIITAEQRHSALRLDRFLKEECALPHALISKLIRKKQIDVNGKFENINYRIEEGDLISVPAFVKQVKQDEPQTFDARKIEYIHSLVAFKNDNILIINKPPKLAVQGGTNVPESLDDYLSYMKFGLIEKPRLTHRIDKDTSGIVLIARNRKYAQILTALFEKRRIHKEYTAILSATPKLLKGEISYAVFKNPMLKKMEVASGKITGQEAITRYEVLKELKDGMCLVKFVPLTGRMHQIRLHASLIGCPILGDKIYGNGTKDILHLHASKIKINDEHLDLDFQIDIPDFFKKHLRS